MHVLTGRAMREADRRTIEEVGIAGCVLMESAGRAVVKVMEERLADLESSSIAVVCGKGNNGGDGLVVLRTLLQLGYEARGFVLAPFESLSADAIDNLQTALKLGFPVDSAPTEEAWLDALPQIASADVIVDAILGTGLSESPRGLFLRAIEDLNALDRVKVAVDVPSGLSSDTGAIFGAAFRADLTVALAAPKVCHFIPPACDHCGEVEVVEIGIPLRFLVGDEPFLETIDPDDLKPLVAPRERASHKGSYGHLLIVAGSMGKTGAAVMAAEGALRSGVGLVTVASPRSVISMMAPRLPEAMWEPLPETARGTIAAAALPRVLSLADDRDAVAIGPGLGLDEETVRFTLGLLEGVAVPVAADADALNALAGASGPVPSKAALALTPHPGEAGRLLGCSASEVERDRIDAARRLAAGRRAHVLLKGYRSLVCDPAGNLRVNLTGNPGMATGGTGDVLTGIVGSFLAQGMTPGDALSLGAHLHGLAGDLAALELGETSLVATDVIRKIPDAFRKLCAA